jgi:hypothetical protein
MRMSSGAQADSRAASPECGGCRELRHLHVRLASARRHGEVLRLVDLASRRLQGLRGCVLFPCAPSTTSTASQPSLPRVWLRELTRSAVSSLCDFPEYVILWYAFGKYLKAVFSSNCVYSNDYSSFLSIVVVD